MLQHYIQSVKEVGYLHQSMDSRVEHGSGALSLDPISTVCFRPHVTRMSSKSMPTRNTLSIGAIARFLSALLFMIKWQLKLHTSTPVMLSIMLPHVILFSLFLYILYLFSFPPLSDPFYWAWLPLAQEPFSETTCYLVQDKLKSQQFVQSLVDDLRAVFSVRPSTVHVHVCI